MENIKRYIEGSDEDTNSSDYVEPTSDIEKNKNIRNNKSKETIKKRKTYTKSVSPTKKMKPEKITSYVQTIGQVIENEDIFDESLNTMTVKQDNHYYTFKYPFGSGEDYWVLQHYKMNDIKDVAVNDRWKHSSGSIKLHTSEHLSSDMDIVNKLNKLIEAISGRFATDPKKKKVTKRKIEKNAI